MQHFPPPPEAARSALASHRIAAFGPQRDRREKPAPVTDPWPSKPVTDSDQPNADHPRYVWASADDVPTGDWKAMLRWLGRHPGQRILPAGSQVVIYTGFREIAVFDRSTWRAYRLRW